MKTKNRVLITTFGCQMNEYDTEVAEGILENSDFEIVDADAYKRMARSTHTAASYAQGPLPKNTENADIILMNTCSVREHAEVRVFGRLGLLGKAKRENPDLIIGLMGCMVEEHREKLFKRFPQLDLMVGTRNLRDLPRLIDEVRQNRTQVSKIQRDGISIEYTDMIKRKTRDHAWLPIMTGCDKVCTYCIVPTTRGSEVSMPARDVYREASRLVDEGVRRIMLLGQNVNSYNGIGTRFPQLLEMLCEIEGLGRISFTTSHPQDATEDLFQVIKRNSKISRRFHLPLQSASDRMLKRMKRLHRFSEYQEKLERLRQLVPDISITTDIITGFSGETDDDHNQTMKALRAIRYDGAYIFKYSIRPGTPAAKLSDNVPEEVKAERHAQLFELQKKIAGENSKAWFGRVVDAFVEQPGGREPGQMICWTNQEKKVLAQADPSMAGRFLKIRLESLRHETFGGVIVNAPVGATS